MSFLPPDRLLLLERGRLFGVVSCGEKSDSEKKMSCTFVLSFFLSFFLFLFSRRGEARAPRPAAEF
jgi:hypothetical protein